MPQLQEELQVARAAVRHAARICQNVRQALQPEVLEKQDRSPVTVADFASQAVICRALQSSFADDAIIGEENADALRQPEQHPFLEHIQTELKQTGLQVSKDDICDWIDAGGTQSYSDRFWTLDPIDGTKGYLRGGQYAVALALVIDGRVAVGVLGCPNLPFLDDQATGSLFTAVRGHGSWLEPLHSDGNASKLHVSQSDSWRICESVESGHSAHGRSGKVAHELGISREPLRMDSQAKYAAVAQGQAEIYLRLPTRAAYTEKIWDHAAGALIVEEAGGQVSDVDGKPLEWTHGYQLEVNRGVVVTNGPAHTRVIQALRNQGV